MISNYSNIDKEFAKKYHWIGLVVVSLAAIPLHFLYEWSGKNIIVGMFTPVNESIWEHLNLVFWPLLLWWGLGYLFFHNSKRLSLPKWVTAGTVSIFLSMYIIVSWHYIWTGGIGFENSLVNVGSLYIAVPIAQLIGIHVYRVVESRKFYMILSVVFLLAFASMLIFFTFATPDFPIFIPSN